jgi:hypothetical protein
MLSLSVVLGIGYVIFIDNLPPRTATKFVRLMTEWSDDIPLNSKTIVFNEKWVVTGDGEVVAVIELDKQKFETIVSKYSTKFNQLDKQFLLYNPNNTDVLYKIDKKYLYQEQKTDNSIKKIILEQGTNRIIVSYIVW